MTIYFQEVVGMPSLGESHVPRPALSQADAHGHPGEAGWVGHPCVDAGEQTEAEG